MDRGAALVIATAIGGALALQPPLNSMLARSVGGLEATIVAYLVGLAVLLSISVLAGGIGGIANAADAPWWALIGGGLLGALYVASIVWTVRALGVGGLAAATISGQFALALVIDHFGWLGVDRQPITAARLAGLALLAAGTWLMVSD